MTRTFQPGYQVPLWTGLRLELLKKLRAEKLSAAAIVVELDGMGITTTRNAVISACHRHRVPGGQSWGGTRTPRRRGAPKSDWKERSVRKMVNHGNRFDMVTVDVPDPLPAEDQPTARAVARRLQLVDLNENTCRWGHGMPGTPDFFFCGEPPLEGLPYCNRHCLRAYTSQRREPMRKSAKASAFG